MPREKPARDSLLAEMAQGVRREITDEEFRTMHIGRHWPSRYKQGQKGSGAGTTIEDECPCPTEPCGLVACDKIDPDCQQHPVGAGKTIRSNHLAADCPKGRP